jgi:hypothetical protein
MIAGMRTKLKSKKVSFVARIALAGAIGLVCASCTNADYQDGVSRAESELQSNNPCIYTISMADRGATDKQTGLPYLVIEAPVTPEELKMIEGHNQTIYARFH